MRWLRRASGGAPRDLSSGAFRRAVSGPWEQTGQNPLAQCCSGLASEPWVLCGRYRVGVLAALSSWGSASTSVRAYPCQVQPRASPEPPRSDRAEGLTRMKVRTKLAPLDQPTTTRRAMSVTNAKVIVSPAELVNPPAPRCSIDSRLTQALGAVGSACEWHSAAPLNCRPYQGCGGRRMVG